jgi:hypothetical protein
MNPGEVRPAVTPQAEAVGTRLAPRILAIVIGAAVVALAAQVSVRLPLTVVPWTLQPLAVLIVGGLLGAGLYQALIARFLPSAQPQEPGEIPAPETLEVSRG